MVLRNKFLAVGLLATLAGVGSAQTTTTSAKKKPAKAASGQATAHSAAHSTGHSVAGHATAGKKIVHGSSKGHAAVSVKGRRRAVVVVKETPESRRLTMAFTASAQLRPMAQQLMATRSAAAYNGVLSYAASHTGEAAAAAELSLGHAYMLDHRYGEAESVFRQASQHGQSLSDYADYLGAQAAVQG